MVDKYHADLSKISLSTYAEEIAQAELLPSRMILKQETKQRFRRLGQNGITNLDQVLLAMNSPKKISELAAKTGIDEEFLKILKREVASFQPKPIQLSEFQGINSKIIRKLAAQGIANSQQLFNLAYTNEGRRELSKKCDVPIEELLELTKLADVARIRWVGANFARVLVDSQCDTLEKVQKANYEKLYHELMTINDEKKYFKGKFGVNDMKLTVIASRSVPAVAQY